MAQVQMRGHWSSGRDVVEGRSYGGWGLPLFLRVKLRRSESFPLSCYCPGEAFISPKPLRLSIPAVPLQNLGFDFTFISSTDRCWLCCGLTVFSCADLVAKVEVVVVLLLMVGAVQVGLLAAFIVLFVPIGLAGWHLSRNKMLFFGGLLFITLAVGVHLTPYLSSVAQLIPSLSVPLVVESQRACLSSLHKVEWQRGKGLNSSSWTWNWARSAPVEVCAFRKVERSDAFKLLNGSWVFVAGDSQARLLVLALLHLVLDEKAVEAVEGDLFKRHSNYQIVIHEHGMKVDFVWAPYESNLTEVFENLKNEIRLPEVMVLGSGLWHMLRFNNASDYGHQLCLLKVSMAHLFRMSELSTFSMRSSHAFWLGMPTLVNSLLNTDEKKERMNIFTWEAYYQEFSESKLLRDSGGPFVLLDMASLTRKCGLACTSDGMHYDGIVYEAALQVLLNALLIESLQLM